jgi:hypothetical protein
MARHLNGPVAEKSYLGLTLASKASVVLDPLTFGMTAFAPAGVAALVCIAPAIRATPIDPVIALRGG